MHHTNINQLNPQEQVWKYEIHVTYVDVSPTASNFILYILITSFITADAVFSLFY